MGSLAPSRLTPLQRELLAAFCEREQRFFLTGGGALAGFYFGHRTTEDLDFFSAPGPNLMEAGRTAEEAARAVGAQIETRSVHPDFRRLVARRGDEECIIDLVIDRAPMVDPQKASFGNVRVDTLREIAANKICALLSRSEIKDLVDLQVLVASGIDLEQAFADAESKEAGAEPATLAWLIDDLRIAPDAPLPGGVDIASLEEFRKSFVKRLRALAFARAQGRTP